MAKKAAPVSNKFAAALKKAGATWGKAKERAKEQRGASNEFEDGKYLARLVEGRIDESGSGRVQVVWGWKFEDGEYEKKIKFSYQGLDSEDNLFYLGRDLERLGYELPDDLAEGLPQILEDIESSKPLCQIRLRTKAGSDFQNVYIMKVYGDDEEEEAEDDAAEEDDAATETEEEAEEEETEETEEETADETDEEETDEEEDEVELVPGLRVIVETSKGREAGKILEVIEKEGKVRVELANGSKVRVTTDKLDLAEEEDDTPDEVEEEEEIDEEEEEEEEEAPPAKSKKAAPAKKAAPVKKAAPPAKGKKGKK